MSRPTRRDGGLAAFRSVRHEGAAVTEALREDYGLTAAETRVALALADGIGVPEICAGQRIGLATVRSHLKSIFRKTETSGQVQLVVLVFKLLRECGPDDPGETPGQVLRRSA